MNFHTALFYICIKYFLCSCREALGKIMARGHSRVPVYDGNPRNLIGVLLVIYDYLGVGMIDYVCIVYRFIHIYIFYLGYL